MESLLSFFWLLLLFSSALGVLTDCQTLCLNFNDPASGSGFSPRESLNLAFASYGLDDILSEPRVTITRDAIGRPTSTLFPYDGGQPTKGGSLVSKYLLQLVTVPTPADLSGCTATCLQSLHKINGYDAGHIVQSASFFGNWVNADPWNFFPQSDESNRKKGCWKRAETLAYSIATKCGFGTSVKISQTFNYQTGSSVPEDEVFVPTGGTYTISMDAICRASLQKGTDTVSSTVNTLAGVTSDISVAWSNGIGDKQSSIITCPIPKVSSGKPKKLRVIKTAKRKSTLTKKTALIILRQTRSGLQYGVL